MFGLLKQNLCKKATTTQSHHYNYCGTCKTIGATFGQSTRFFLNNDVVFLSSLLNDLARSTTDEKIIHHSCFSLPQKDMIHPVFYYTSSLNVFLTEVKFKDTINDHSGYKKYVGKSGKLLFTSSFKRAKHKLSQLDFPLQKINSLLILNNELELQKNLPLEKYYSPTAHITGLCFQFGAKLIHQSEEVLNTMKNIGDALGKLVYLMDMHLDLAKDSIENHFNPVIVSNKVCETDLQTEINTAKQALLNNLTLLNISPILLNRYSKTISSLNYYGDKPGRKEGFFEKLQGLNFLEPCSECACDSCCCDGCDGCGGCDC